MPLNLTICLALFFSHDGPFANVALAVAPVYLGLAIASMLAIAGMVAFFVVARRLAQQRQASTKAAQQYQTLQNKLVQLNEALANPQTTTEASATNHPPDNTAHAVLLNTLNMLAAKNVLLADLLRRVKQAEEQADNAKELKQLKKLLKANIELESQWESIETQFEALYPQFLDSLRTTCPDITDNELKHCLYIKMNMSNKEISGLTNISPQSVKMARNRLKKKLGLGKDQSLKAFIHQLPPK